MEDKELRLPRQRTSISRRTFIQFLGVGAATGILAACAPTAPAAPSEAPAAEAPAASVDGPGTAEGGLMRPAGTPKRGGTLRIAVGVTTSNYDLHQGAAAHCLGMYHNNVIRYNLVDGLHTKIPDLAQGWEVSDDGLTYTFSLREGVKFHDGTPFSADDVVANFDRIINPPDHIISTRRNNFLVVSSVEAPDPQTVVFTLSSPRAFFLDLLCEPILGIYSKATLEANNYNLREVIAPGTGAFKHVEYLTSEKWTMERNPDYWDSELPYVDKIEMIHVPAWSDRGTAVLTDQADLSWNVSFETWSEGETRSDIVQVRKLANFGGYWVYFNCEAAPFDNPLVRKAIHLAVSRQNMIAAFGTQEQINLTRWIPYGDPYATTPEEIATLPGYREDKTEDIEAAKALLAEAGFADGIDGVELLAGAGPQAELLAPAFQDMLLRSLNIRAEIRIVERSLLPEERKNGTYQMVIDVDGATISDITPRADIFWKTGGSSNWTRYSNPALDELLALIEVELDAATRQDLINQAMNLLDEDPPAYHVGYTFHLPMWSAALKGLGVGLRDFAEWGRVETAWFDV